MFVLRGILLFAFLLTAAAGAQLKNQNGLRVAAAADLSPVMDKLATAFEKQTGIHLTVSLGSSGNFFAEIRNGAPFDVFLAADKSYPESLEQVGKTEGAVVAFARGRLVIWAANSSSLQLLSKNQVLEGNLDSLTGPAVGKIAIANPEHAPYGRAAIAALVHYQVIDQVKGKLVLGENVSQAAQFAQSGNADVALIPLSLAASGAMQQRGRWALLPEDSYPPIEQAGAVLKSSPHKAEARHFLEFLISPEGQALLHDFGFEAPTR